MNKAPKLKTQLISEQACAKLHQSNPEKLTKLTTAISQLYLQNNLPGTNLREKEENLRKIIDNKDKSESAINENLHNALGFFLLSRTSENIREQIEAVIEFSHNYLNSLPSDKIIEFSKKTLETPNILLKKILAERAQIGAELGLNLTGTKNPSALGPITENFEFDILPSCIGNDFYQDIFTIQPNIPETTVHQDKPSIFEITLEKTTNPSRPSFDNFLILRRAHKTLQEFSKFCETITSNQELKGLFVPNYEYSSNFNIQPEYPEGKISHYATKGPNKKSKTSQLHSIIFGLISSIILKNHHQKETTSSNEINLQTLSTKDLRELVAALAPLFQELKDYYKIFNNEDPSIECIKLNEDCQSPLLDTKIKIPKANRYIIESKNDNQTTIQDSEAPQLTIVKNFLRKHLMQNNNWEQIKEKFLTENLATENFDQFFLDTATNIIFDLNYLINTDDFAPKQDNIDFSAKYLSNKFLENIAIQEFQSSPRSSKPAKQNTNYFELHQLNENSFQAKIEQSQKKDELMNDTELTDLIITIDRQKVETSKTHELKMTQEQFRKTKIHYLLTLEKQELIQLLNCKSKKQISSMSRSLNLTILTDLLNQESTNILSKTTYKEIIPILDKIQTQENVINQAFLDPTFLELKTHISQLIITHLKTKIPKFKAQIEELKLKISQIPKTEIDNLFKNKNYQALQGFIKKHQSTPQPTITIIDDAFLENLNSQCNSIIEAEIDLDVIAINIIRIKNSGDTILQEILQDLANLNNTTLTLYEDDIKFSMYLGEDIECAMYQEDLYMVLAYKILTSKEPPNQKERNILQNIFTKKSKDIAILFDKLIKNSTFLFHLNLIIQNETLATIPQLQSIIALIIQTIYMENPTLHEEIIQTLHLEKLIHEKLSSHRYNIPDRTRKSVEGIYEHEGKNLTHIIEDIKKDIKEGGVNYFKEKEEEAYQKQLNNLDFKI